jgi:hypothetical protein
LEGSTAALLSQLTEPEGGAKEQAGAGESHLQSPVFHLSTHPPKVPPFLLGGLILLSAICYLRREVVNSTVALGMTVQERRLHSQVTVESQQRSRTERALLVEVEAAATADGSRWCGLARRNPPIETVAGRRHLGAFQTRNWLKYRKNLHPALFQGY